jgi:hypothetical protein
MKKTIILEAKSFSYPTKEENLLLNNYIPTFNKFEIKYNPAIESYLNNINIDESIRKEDIYWWNNCFENRLNKMLQTYGYVLTHYNRLSNKNNENFNENTEKLLLNYYIEIFYYYFSSTKEVLAHFFNSYFNMKLEEKKFFLSKYLIENIPNDIIKKELKYFLEKTLQSQEIRNAFTHRFTPTLIDNRAKKTVILTENSVSFYSPKEVSSEDFLEDIKSIVLDFSNLINNISFYLQ